MVSNERSGHLWESIIKEDDLSLEETKGGFSDEVTFEKGVEK